MSARSNWLHELERLGLPVSPTLRAYLTARMHTNPSLSQVGFRLRNDDGSQTTATWKANENTNATIGVDENFRIRFVVDETAGGAENNVTFQLQYSHNGGTFTNVTALAVVARPSASPNVTDSTATTRQLTSGTGTFVANSFDEVDGLSGVTTFSGGEVTEVEYCVQILSGAVANNDTVAFRVIRGSGSALENYAQTPTVTVSEASSDHALGRIHAIRGVKTSGDPWNITSGNAEATSDTSLSATGATTTAPDCLVLILAALMDDDQDFGGTWTNADLANIIVRQNSPGTAGNDGRHILVTGEKASAGAYGATTNTLTASSVKAMMTVALEGAPNVHTGEGSPVVTAPALAAVGLLAFIGAGALSVTAPSISGSGSLIESRTATAALAVTAPSLSASGSLVFTATGALSVTAPAIAGSGSQFFDVEGSAALTVSPPAIAGTGSITQASVEGSGALSVTAPSLSASGTLAFDGTGELGVTAPSIAASGTEAFVATGDLGVSTSISGAGLETFVGTGTVLVPAPLIQGGEEGISGGVVAVHSATVAIVDSHSGTGEIVTRHGTSIMDTYTCDNDTGTCDSTHHTADDAPMRYV